MKIHTFEEISSSIYPVGENMDIAKEFIRKAIPVLKPLIKNKLVNIWVRGSSGAILGGLLVGKLTNDCIIFHVKKEGEDSHHGNDFSNWYSRKQGINIILDDFIQTGKTVNAIWEEMKARKAKVHILLVVNNKRDIWFADFVPTHLISEKGDAQPGWNKLGVKKKETIQVDIDF
jgi:hypothetical protein